MRGFTHEPDGIIEGVVVVHHGYFSGTSLGPARFFVELAERLARRNLATWRIDRWGTGNSDGEFATISYDDQVDGAKAMLRRARDKYGVPVHVVGHSAGCAIAMKALLSLKLRPATLHCLAPTLNPVEPDSGFFSQRQVDELDETGWTERNGLTIKKVYLEQMRDASFLGAGSLLAGVPGEVYFGAEDRVWGKSGAIRIEESLGLPVVEVRGADHNLLPSSARRELLERLERSICRSHRAPSTEDERTVVVPPAASADTWVRRSSGRTPSRAGSAT